MALLSSEERALALAEGVIVTSEFTRRLVVDEFNVSPTKVTVCKPGTDPAARARGSIDGVIRLLAVGSISARKGYSDIVSALSTLKQLQWHLTIVGSLSRDPATVKSLRAQIARTGLANRITLVGDISDRELDGFYENADSLISASHFEGYGMVLTEAMARGLPLVTSTAGAATETVPDDAAVKFSPGSIPTLRTALETIIRDPVKRKVLGAASWEFGRTLPSWRDTARCIAAKLTELASA
jgi:glycosyltransferase involved in cell wall biosynthesis